MKLEWNKKYTTIAIYAALVLLASTVVIFLFVGNRDFGAFFSKLSSALSPITFGLIFAYLLNPAVKFFDTKVFAFIDMKKPRTRLRRALSVTATMIIFAMFLVFLIWSLAPQLISSISDLQAQLVNYTSKLSVWLEAQAETSKYFGSTLLKAAEYVSGIVGQTYGLVEKLIPWLGTAAASLLNVLRVSLIGILFAFFFLCSKEYFGAHAKKVLRAFTDESKYEKFMSATSRIDKSFGGYIKGTILDAVIVGIVFFYLMLIFGIPYYPLIAMILAITNMIPVFGPYIGSIPSGIIILGGAGPEKLIIFIIMVLAVQAIDGNVVAPKLIGSRIGMPSEWVVIAITVMSGFFGALGLVIGVPIFSVIYMLVSEKVQARLIKRGLPCETVDYCDENGKLIFEEANAEKPEKKINIGFLKKLFRKKNK